MNKSNINKIVKISVLLVMVVGLCIITIITKNKHNTLDEIKTIYNDHPEMFAMYLQNANGTYIKAASEVTNFPNPQNYELNIQRSLCYDNEGNIVTSALGYVNYEVTVQTSRTLFCNLYFDRIDHGVTRRDILVHLSNYQTVPGYINTITSSDGTGSWDSLYNRMIISSVSKAVEAEFTLSSAADNNSYTLLKTIAETTGSSGDGDVVNEGTAGYRYEGKNPNNYVWFNNELWRIIGSVPVCLTASCGDSSTRLVKIIRDTSIGTLVFDIEDTHNMTSEWGSNSLYKLLNGCYYGKKNMLNNDYDSNNASTLCSTYCITWFGDADPSHEYARRVGNCNYTYKGISSSASDYYNSMIKNVYWNTGQINYETMNPSAAYTAEKGTQTVQGKVGLMNASDFGYATTYGTAVLDNYDMNYFNLSWMRLFDNWTINRTYVTPSNVFGGDRSYVYCGGVYGSDDVGYPNSSNHDARVNPVVYLDANVYVKSGNGSEANPYKLGM